MLSIHWTFLAPIFHHTVSLFLQIKFFMLWRQTHIIYSAKFAFCFYVTCNSYFAGMCTFDKQFKLKIWLSDSFPINSNIIEVMWSVVLSWIDFSDKFCDNETPETRLILLHCSCVAGALHPIIKCWGWVNK